MLQFENASYGIEPLVNSPAFEHFIYHMSNESMADFLLAKSRAESGARPAVQEVSYKAHTTLEVSALMVALMAASALVSLGPSKKLAFLTYHDSNGEIN